MKQDVCFWRIGCVVLTAGLLGCEATGSSEKRQAKVAVAQADPPVLTAARHYARLLTRDTIPPPDSLLCYAQRVAQPDVLPGRYLLCLRAYTIILEPDSPRPQVTIEPVASTQFYKLLPLGGLRKQHDTVHVSPTPRKTNPALPATLSELVAVFGPWHGDFYAPVEEPSAPDMHTTSLSYRNPATGHECRVFVQLRNTPQANTNAVHNIQLTRVRESP